MKLQRVYPVVVRWRKGTAPTAGQKITVRLLMAGAQILPTEQVLDAGKPDAAATFYVTPLARGWLRAQRLEIIHDGRKVQEVPLASKATTHRLTWCMLLLTFLLPWFINTYVKHSPFLESTSPGPNNVKVTKINLGVDSNTNKSRILTDVEKTWSDNLPEMPEIVDEYVPQLKPALKNAREWSAETYVELVHASQLQPYSFFGGMIFLFLTLASAVTHRDMRRKRLSKPIPLPNLAKDDADEEVAEATA